jgi:hypothetical protein
MNPRLIAVMIFVLLAVIALPIMMRLGLGEKPEPVTLDEIDAGTGRTIRVTIQPNSQGSLSLRYHVQVDGKPVVERAFFGTLPRTATPPGFVTYFAQDGDLVGIAQASVPNRVIILHDFATGESWPMKITTYKDTDPQHLYPYYEQEDAMLARGDALFSRLAGANPDTPLELLRTMGMRPLSVPTLDKNPNPPAVPGSGQSAP